MKDVNRANDFQVVPASHLPALRLLWPASKKILRDELVTRGWYQRHMPVERPLAHIMGAVGVVLGFLGLMLAVAASEPWALLGTLLLGAGGAAAIKLGNNVSEATEDGAQVVAPWRAYLANVKAASGNQYLDEALPYIIAAGMADAFADRLRVASAAGYSPDWFRPHNDHRVASVGFYPYWSTFHSCMYPVVSGGAGHSSASSFSAGGFAGGDAAGGGGGGGGGF